MKRNILICMVVAFFIFSSQASAFWGSDTAGAASGLDVAAGFDVNTITTIAGKVTAPPERKGDKQHTLMAVAAARGTITVVLGPWWYWEKQNITIAENQELSITGSLAQGKDGALYLFAQRIENLSTGGTVTLRSETGKPLWSRGGSRSGTGTQGNGMRGRRQ